MKPTTKRRSVIIAGTSVLGALVVVLDYALKFSGLKIPFPWMPLLKFDFTGIPILLSLALYGLPSGVATSMIAFFAIVARSGDYVGASMKMLAELLSVLGAAIFLRKTGVFWKGLSATCSLTARVVGMSLANLIVFPIFYNTPLMAAVTLLPPIAVFNVMQGAISFFGGYVIYMLLKIRLPLIH